MKRMLAPKRSFAPSRCFVFGAKTSRNPRVSLRLFMEGLAKISSFVLAQESRAQMAGLVKLRFRTTIKNPSRVIRFLLRSLQKVPFGSPWKVGSTVVCGPFSEGHWGLTGVARAQTHTSPPPQKWNWGRGVTPRIPFVVPFSLLWGRLDKCNWGPPHPPSPAGRGDTHTTNWGSRDDLMPCWGDHFLAATAVDLKMSLHGNMFAPPQTSRGCLRFQGAATKQPPSLD